MQKSKRSGRVSPTNRIRRETPGFAVNFLSTQSLAESTDSQPQPEEKPKDLIFFGRPECYWHTMLSGLAFSILVLLHAYFPLLQELVLVLDNNYMYFDHFVVPTFTAAICAAQSLFIGLYYGHPFLLRPFLDFCRVFKIILLPNACYYFYRFGRVAGVLVYKQLTETEAKCSWKCIERFVQNDADLKTATLLFAGLIFAVDASRAVSKCIDYMIMELMKKSS